MKIHLLSCLLFLVILFPACNSENSSQGVQFPEVSEPIAITPGPNEHLFASYYGINSWSADQRFVTVLQTPIKYRLPTEKDPATLGLVDGKYVSIILDVYTREKIKTIPYPVAAVSPSGKEAVSINFSRIRHTRESYGYGGDGQDAKLDVQFPEDDGLFLVNLETGKSKLLVSILDVKDQVPEVPEDGIGYFNHVLFSRDGGKIFWLSRAIPERNTTSFTINRDGTNLNSCFPDGWGGSHFDWLSGDELMITTKYKAADNAHILFTIGQQNYKRLGNGIFDYDGHVTFSPDKKWMVTELTPLKV